MTDKADDEWLQEYESGIRKEVEDRMKLMIDQVNAQSVVVDDDYLLGVLHTITVNMVSDNGGVFPARAEDIISAMRLLMTRVIFQQSKQFIEFEMKNGRVAH